MMLIANLNFSGFFIFFLRETLFKLRLIVLIKLNKSSFSCLPVFVQCLRLTGGSVKAKTHITKKHNVWVTNVAAEMTEQRIHDSKKPHWSYFLTFATWYCICTVSYYGKWNGNTLLTHYLWIGVNFFTIIFIFIFFNAANHLQRTRQITWGVYQLVIHWGKNTPKSTIYAKTQH